MKRKGEIDGSVNDDNAKKSLSSLSDDNSPENVLILQGGGSLGAFGCGVFKALVNNKVKIDIAAGTSIGGINAAIIAGSRDEKHPEVALEQFWLELSQGFEDLQPFGYYYNLPTDLSEQKNDSSSAMNASKQAMKIKQLRSL